MVLSNINEISDNDSETIMLVHYLTRSHNYPHKSAAFMAWNFSKAF